MEKEAEKYKDLPATTFIVIDPNQNLYDPLNNELILCSRTVREKAFYEKIDRIMEINRRNMNGSTSRDRLPLTLSEIRDLEGRELTS